MKYGEFKTEILEELRDFYGKDAEISIKRVLRNNGKRYDGIHIVMTASPNSPVPVIELDSFYKAYRKGEMDMDDCMEAICRERTRYDCPDADVGRLAVRAADWEFAKESVYPILLSTEENQELLETLVSVPMLDLSVAYIIRGEKSGEYAYSLKVTKPLLDNYGISQQELHGQAMKNLAEDGYRFESMDSLLEGMRKGKENPTEGDGTEPPIRMYVLTHPRGAYGAAGILNKELLMNFAGQQDFYILPSSVHETIFLPATDKCDRELLDSMVQTVNRTSVDREDKLSDHCYYYDAETGEIRMSA